MTDDFTPVELSWNWGAGDEPIVVRFSIEPIGSYAGTPIDPLNEYATHHLVQGFQSIIPGTDLEWFHFFSHQLLVHTQSLSERSPIGKAEERSSTFVAFDLEENGLSVKAYFIPALRAAITGQTRLAVVAQAIENLPPVQLNSISNSFSLMLDYLKLSEKRLQLEVEILGIDCIIPAESRLKVYFRSVSTCFNSVRDVMTLGAKISGCGSDRALDDLEELWQLLLWSDKCYSPEKELRYNQHRTAGVLYYFEIRPGHAEPIPKVYVPVRHYGQNDEDVVEKLQTFMRHRRSSCDVDNYMQALKTAL